MAAALLVSLLFESGLETGTRFSFQYLIDHAIVPRHPSNLTLLLILLGIAGIVLTLLCVLADYLWAKLGNNVISEIRSDLYLHLQSLSVDFFARRSSGDLLNCFISDVNELENCLVTAAPYGILGLASILFSSSLMATIHPLLAAATFCGLVVCFLAPRLMTARARRASLESRRQEGRLSSNVQEMLQSQSLVKVFGLERELLRRFSRENQRMVEISVRASFLAYISQRIPSLFFFLLCLLVLGGSAVLAFHGKLSVGEVVAFQVMVLGLGSAINNLTWLTPLVLGATASMDRLNEIYRESPATHEEPDAPPLPALSRSICFEDVTFRYPATPEDTGRSVARPVARDRQGRICRYCRSQRFRKDFHSPPPAAPLRSRGRTNPVRRSRYPWCPYRLAPFTNRFCGPGNPAIQHVGAGQCPNGQTGRHGFRDLGGSGIGGDRCLCPATARRPRYPAWRERLATFRGRAPATRPWPVPSSDNRRFSRWTRLPRLWMSRTKPSC